MPAPARVHAPRPTSIAATPTTSVEGRGAACAKPGENACKGMGECGVPMGGKTWTKARTRFEELMKAEGKKVGPAPPKKA